LLVFSKIATGAAVATLENVMILTGLLGVGGAGSRTATSMVRFFAHGTSNAALTATKLRLLVQCPMASTAGLQDHTPETTSCLPHKTPRCTPSCSRYRASASDGAPCALAASPTPRARPLLLHLRSGRGAAMVPLLRLLPGPTGTRTASGGAFHSSTGLAPWVVRTPSPCLSARVSSPGLDSSARTPSPCQHASPPFLLGTSPHLSPLRAPQFLTPSFLH
jgi:hypothetical protein